jgi:hypothetical protein
LLVFGGLGLGFPGLLLFPILLSCAVLLCCWVAGRIADSLLKMDQLQGSTGRQQTEVLCLLCLMGSHLPRCLHQLSFCGSLHCIIVGEVAGILMWREIFAGGWQLEVLCLHILCWVQVLPDVCRSLLFAASCFNQSLWPQKSVVIVWNCSSQGSRVHQLSTILMSPNLSFNVIFFSSLEFLPDYIESLYVYLPSMYFFLMLSNIITYMIVFLVLVSALE